MIIVIIMHKSKEQLKDMYSFLSYVWAICRQRANKNWKRTKIKREVVKDVLNLEGKTYNYIMEVGMAFMDVETIPAFVLDYQQQLTLRMHNRKTTHE